MDKTIYSETSVNYQTTQRHILQDRTLLAEYDRSDL